MISKTLRAFSKSSYLNKQIHGGLKNNFASLASLKFTDVVKMYDDEKGYFIELPARTISFDPRLNLSQIKNLAAKENKNIQKINFYDENLVEYSDAIPGQALFSEDFLLKINDEWYSIIPAVKHPLFDLESKHTLNQNAIHSLCRNSGLTLRQTAVLSRFVSSYIEDLHENLNKNIDQHQVDLILEKTILNHAIQAKSESERIDKKLEYLKNKLLKLEEAKKVIDDKLIEKGKKRLKYFFSFIFTQIAAIQYGTYVAFSWDIMEPITCLLGIFDLIIAYTFWLMSNNQYSFPAIVSNYAAKRGMKAYQKGNLSIDELETVRELIEMLEAKKAFLSPNMEVVLKSLDIAGEKNNKSDD